MKCISKINKLGLLCLFVIAALFISGCGSKDVVSYENSYDVYETSISYGIANNSSSADSQYFSKDLCVADDFNFGIEEVHSSVAGAAASFNLSTGEVTYAQNIYDKMYPASTTKIMTCYLALKYGDLDEYVTVSANAADQPSDASVCKVKTGDVLTLRDLLYGLMLASGNDAAIAIAEHISGDVDSFVELMNEEALAMGATCTQYRNPHGMPAEGHYTSAYDLYLIFSNAIQNEEFVEIISAKKYTAVITESDGDVREREWENSNRYLNGKADAPEEITVVGGKTGTTSEAGYCLVLLSYNTLSEPIVSVVLKSDGPSNLYLLTGEILSRFNN